MFSDGYYVTQLVYKLFCIYRHFWDCFVMPDDGTHSTLLLRRDVLPPSFPLLPARWEYTNMSVGAFI